MSPSLFLFSLLLPLSTKPSFKAQRQSGRLLWVCACLCCWETRKEKEKKKKLVWFVKMQPVWKEQEIIMSHHILIGVFCSSIPSLLHPPSFSHIHFTKRPTSFYHCGFENRQGEKCLKVLGIQLFQSMNLGRSLKSVLPFIVPCGKICAAKVSRVRQPMTCCLLSARCQLTSERKGDP